MNISNETIKQLESEYLCCFYDKNTNIVTPQDAHELHIGFSIVSGDYIGKRILATKKETTMAYIQEKLSAERIYINFCNKFNDIIRIYGLSAYPTSYGIGVFVLFGNRDGINRTKEQIHKELTNLDIEFTTEYSEANWVFRYKISKSRQNIEKINKIIQ